MMLPWLLATLGSFGWWGLRQSLRSEALVGCAWVSLWLIVAIYPPYGTIFGDVRSISSRTFAIVHG